MKWDTVIGLEVHVQLLTQSKLFSGAATHFGAQPNSQTCFIDAGLPGVLPSLNQQAVVMAIQFGLAINATINHLSYFERKNYFYPDLPKGYQISQFQRPIVSHGQLTIPLPNQLNKKVEIVRAHLEEDAGKLVHDGHLNHTGVDLNRAGNPLLEVVTAPCLDSAQQVTSYLKTLHQLVRFLGICDGNMQEGSFRCDVNISLKPQGSKKLGTRTELKNLNSFRFIEKAIAYEQARQQELLEQGLSITQETRLFCPVTETTQVLRQKVNEHDYRYFPDPDLLPIALSEETLQHIKNTLPILPAAIHESLQTLGTLSTEDIQFILTTPATYHFFTEVKKYAQVEDKMIINWLKGPYSAALNEHNLSFDNPSVKARELAVLLVNLSQQRFSGKIAKQIFNKLWQTHEKIETLLAKKEYQQVQDDSLLATLIQTVIMAHPQQVQDYRAGKEKLLAFFIGQVMKSTKGQANPEQVSELIKEQLKT